MRLLNIKNFELCCDWKDWHGELINIELFSIHLEKLNSKPHTGWITILGITLYWERT